MHAFLVYTIKIHLIYSLSEPVISHEALSSMLYWNENHIFYILMLFMSCVLFHKAADTSICAGFQCLLTTSVNRRYFISLLVKRDAKLGPAGYVRGNVPKN